MWSKILCQKKEPTYDLLPTTYCITPPSAGGHTLFAIQRAQVR
jgi:hypothetical protein